MSVAEALEQVPERHYVQVAPHEVARLNAARERAEAFATLKKVVAADKEWAERRFGEEGTREFRDANGRRLATLNHRAPNQLDQKMLRERYPREAADCTHPSPYDYVTFG
jgi:hypothetical protein